MINKLKINVFMYTVEEFKTVFRKWIEQKLSQKRDDSYYNYYVNKQNTKVNIIKLLEI